MQIDCTPCYRLKNYKDKKEQINYNICHTHPGHEVGFRLRLYYFFHAQILKKKRTNKKITKQYPKIRGWVNYHKHIQSAKAFSHASTVIFETLMRWARRRHPDKGPGWIKKKYFSLTGRKWVFSCKSKQQKGIYKIHELLKPSATKLYRYIKIKGKANPFNPKYREYFEMRRLLSNTVAI